jgi:hypothetical protein
MVLVLGGAAAWSSGAQAIPIAGTVVTVLLIFFNHWKNIVTLFAERRRKR